MARKTPELIWVIEAPAVLTYGPEALAELSNVNAEGTSVAEPVKLVEAKDFAFDVCAIHEVHAPVGRVDDAPCIVFVGGDRVEEIEEAIKRLGSVIRSIV